MSGQTGRIESGELLIPSEADWLADFKHELLGFPYSRHNDQVDALAQLLGWSTTALTMHRGMAGPKLHD